MLTHRNLIMNVAQFLSFSGDDMRESIRQEGHNRHHWSEHLLQQPVESALVLRESAKGLSLAGGMALQEEVALRWRKITGTEVAEGYGLTEASPVLMLNPAGRAKLGSIGVPHPSTEMKCVDDQGDEAAIGEPAKLSYAGRRSCPVTGSNPAKHGMSCSMGGCAPATSGKSMPKAIPLWTGART